MEKKIKEPSKAYKNLDFINSKEARTLRILAEYMEPEKRLSQMGILNTVVFFGSSRIRAENDNMFSQCYFAAEKLSYKLSVWANKIKKEKKKHFCVCTGGGPGIMEAANKGATRAKAPSIGFNISLPKEQYSNQFIPSELNFEFHYFFMRKFWFLYQAKAIVVFPGGFGTMDELFEALTLIQTHKLSQKKIPILLYDKKFWNDIINFEKLVKYGLISSEDLNLFHFFSDIDDGFNYLIDKLSDLLL